MVKVIYDIIYNYARYFIFKDIHEELMEKNYLPIKSSDLTIITFRQTRYTICCGICRQTRIITNSYDLNPSENFWTGDNWCYSCCADEY